MSTGWKLVCPKCGSDDIRQYGTVAASWGGAPWEITTVLPDGKESKYREWWDDGNGADMAWDVCEIEAYYCQNGNCQNVMKTLEEMSAEEVEDD
jgi:hypothetical protein